MHLSIPQAASLSNIIYISLSQLSAFIFSKKATELCAMPAKKVIILESGGLGDCTILISKLITQIGKEVLSEMAFGGSSVFKALLEDFFGVKPRFYVINHWYQYKQVQSRELPRYLDTAIKFRSWLRQEDITLIVEPRRWFPNHFLLHLLSPGNVKVLSAGLQSLSGRSYFIPQNFYDNEYSYYDRVSYLLADQILCAPKASVVTPEEKSIPLKRILVNGVASKPEKWIPSNVLLQVLKDISMNGYELIFIYHNQDEYIYTQKLAAACNENLSIASVYLTKSNLLQLPEVFSSTSLVVTADSFIWHAARACKVPVIGMVNSSIASRSWPFQADAAAIYWFNPHSSEIERKITEHR